MDPTSPFHEGVHTKPLAPSRLIHVNFCNVCHHVWKAPAVAKTCINCKGNGECARSLVAYRNRGADHMTLLKQLKIKSPHHQPDGDAIRTHAEFLAREIHADVMASESAIADAIEKAIREHVALKRKT